MNRHLPALFLALCVASQAFGINYRINVDAQTPGEDITLDRVFTGNSLLLELYNYDEGVPDPLGTNWTVVFHAFEDRYTTNGSMQVTGAVTTNHIVFESGTNVFFEEDEDYYWSVVATHNNGTTKTLARGRMIQEYDPAAGSPSALLGKTAINWDLYSFTGAPPWISNTGAFLNAWADLLVTGANWHAVMERSNTTDNEVVLGPTIHNIYNENTDDAGWIDVWGGRTNITNAAHIFVMGNLASANSGQVWAVAGNVANGRAVLATSNQIPRFAANHNGQLQAFTNRIVFLGAPVATNDGARWADVIAATNNHGIDSVLGSDSIFNTDISFSGDRTNLAANATSSYTLAGSPVITEGSRITVQGSNATDRGWLLLHSGNGAGYTGDVRFTIGPSQEYVLTPRYMNFYSNQLTNVSSIFLSNGTSLTGTPLYAESDTLDSVTTRGNTTDVDLIFSRFALIRGDTTDGNDTNYISIHAAGGTNITQGANFAVYGNDHGSKPGYVWLQAGLNPTGGVFIVTSNNNIRAWWSHAGVAQFMTNTVMGMRLGSTVVWSNNSMPFVDATYDLGTSTTAWRRINLTDGLYAGGNKLLGTNASGQASLTGIAEASSNFTVLGTTDLKMLVDMFTNRISNLGAPTGTNDAARLQDIINRTNTLAQNTLLLENIVAISNFVGSSQRLRFSNDQGISANTPDGADSDEITMCGGGATANSESRGAFNRLHGNEDSPAFGYNIIGSGQTNGARIQFVTSNEIPQGWISYEGKWDFMTNLMQNGTCSTGMVWNGTKVGSNYMALAIAPTNIRFAAKTVSEWGTSGTWQDGSTIANGLVTAIGSGSTNRMIELFVADPAKLSAEIILNGVATNGLNWTLTNASHQSSGTYSNTFLVAAGTTATITQSNTPSMTIGQGYLIRYRAIWFDDTVTNTLVVGGWTNSQVITASGTQTIYTTCQDTTENFTLTVRTGPNQGMYIDDISMRPFNGGIGYIHHLRVGGTISFGGTNYTAFPSGGGGAGATGDWWTNQPDTTITATTNTHPGAVNTRVLASVDGTNLAWVAQGDGTNTSFTTTWTNNAWDSNGDLVITHNLAVQSVVVQTFKDNEFFLAESTLTDANSVTLHLADLTNAWSTSTGRVIAVSVGGATIGVTPTVFQASNDIWRAGIAANASTNGSQAVTLVGHAARIGTNETSALTVVARSNAWDSAVPTIAMICMTNNTPQAIADADGFVTISNWVSSIVDTGYTVSDTNIVVTSAGRYSIESCFSLFTDTASDIDCHLYTNEVEALTTAGATIGWRRSTGNNAYGVVSACGILNLGANTRVEWRIDAIGADEDLTYHNAHFKIESR